MTWEDPLLMLHQEKPFCSRVSWAITTFLKTLKPAWVALGSFGCPLKNVKSLDPFERSLKYLSKNVYSLSVSGYLSILHNSLEVSQSALYIFVMS